MLKLIMIGLLLFLFGGCSSIHSPYDLHDWCLTMGSTRLASIGEKAYDRAECDKELEEDLADRTPRILYVPKDVIMSPFIAARGLWTLLGWTEPPF